MALCPWVSSLAPLPFALSLSKGPRLPLPLDPFALSLSKGRAVSCGQGFDALSPNAASRNRFAFTKRDRIYVLASAVLPSSTTARQAKVAPPSAPV